MTNVRQADERSHHKMKVMRASRPDKSHRTHCVGWRGWLPVAILKTILLTTLATPVQARWLSAFISSLDPGIHQTSRVRKHPFCEVGSVRYGTQADDDAQDRPRKKKFSINQNLSVSISSDGVLRDHRPKPSSKASRLGIPSKRKTVYDTCSSLDVAKNSKMSKQNRQRTASGSVDSTMEYGVSDPENEEIQVQEAKRGSKTVTIIRGMTSPMDDRKKLLKEMKRSFGVGGTLVEGVLELQGPFSNQAVGVLQNNGYRKARKIGRSKK